MISTICRICFPILVLICTLSHALAGETNQEQAANWEPVIILSGNAQVFEGDTPGPKIPPGTVVYVSHRKEGWLLVPRYNSWLHEHHVRSLPDALTFLDEAIQKQPSGNLHHYRAIVLSELGRPDEAIAAFDQAIAEGTDSSNLFLNRGLAWARAGNAELAFSDFEIAIQRDNANSQAYFNQGVLHSQADRYAEALDRFSRAIEYEPAYAEAFNNRGVAHEELQQHDSALADYNRAIELRPRYPGALTNRAYIRQTQGEFSSAISDYAAALRMAPDAHPTLNDLAWLLATCRDENIRNGPSAVQYAERVCKLTDFKDADYLDTLSAALAATGDFDRAADLIRNAIEIAPQDTRQELQARLELYLKHEPFIDLDSPGKRSAEATTTLESIPSAPERGADTTK